MVAEGGKSKGIEAQVGVIKVNDGMNFTSTLSSSDHSRFPCRRILILNQSSHRLMERVAVEVQKRLSQLPFVEEVVYLPAGRHPAEGRLAPDVTILLDMPRIKQIKLPLYRILDATILVAAGSTPYPSSSHYTDQTTPPVLDFKWNGDLSHKSRMIGYETASAKYTLAANDIAGEIAKGLSKQLTEWTDKSGSMPTLPDSFYGTYHPPAKMSFLPGDSLECVQSNRGLMKHNETAWRFADNRDTTIALDAIKRQLEGEGWKDYDSEVAGKNSSALRMTRETERLVAFRQEHRFMARQLEVSKPGKPRPTMPLIVHYEDVFSDQETEKALRDLLESGAPSDTLVIFEKFFVRGGLRDRFCEAIEKRPAASVEANIALAQLYQSRGEKDKACRALFRARASLRTLREHADLQRKVEELAQEIGDKKLAEAPIPDEVFREAGFVEITSAPATIEREVGLNEPVVFYHKAAGNTPNTICVRVKRSAGADSTSPYELHWLEAQDNSRGWGNTGSKADRAKPWTANWGFTLSGPQGGHSGSVQAESLSSGRFRIRIQVSR